MNVTIKDSEELVLYIKSLLVDNMNTRILESNSEKPAPTLAESKPKDFFFIYRANPNRGAIFSIMLNEIVAIENTNLVSFDYNITCQVQIIDNAHKDDVYIKTLRYTDIMYKILNDDTDNIVNGDNIRISSIAPYLSIQDEKDRFRLRSIGEVNFKITLAGGIC